MHQVNQFAPMNQQPTAYQQERKSIGEKYKKKYQRFGVSLYSKPISYIVMKYIGNGSSSL